jgi:hypothetical protein
MYRHKNNSIFLLCVSIIFIRGITIMSGHNFNYLFKLMILLRQLFFKTFILENIFFMLLKSKMVIWSRHKFHKLDLGLPSLSHRDLAGWYEISLLTCMVIHYNYIRPTFGPVFETSNSLFDSPEKEHRNNNFTTASKNLARYRTQNNFILGHQNNYGRPSVIMLL